MKKSYSETNIFKSKIKNSMGVNIIGLVLVIMAGWVDTVGVSLLLIESPAFMTGRGLILGYHAFNADFKTFINIYLVVIAFTIGAFLSTLITKKTGLMGGLIFTGILLIMASFPICVKNITIDTILVPMAMGCQNAATSLTPISRTTHLTGPATDIGINIAKGNWKIVGFWLIRWMGFIIGSIIGFNLVSMVNNNIISVSLTLAIPGAVIITSGILQRLTFNIPLID